MENKFGYGIDELARRGPVKRTKLFEDIKQGLLIARKCGRRTIILHEDFEAYLRALPVVDRNAGKAA